MSDERLSAKLNNGLLILMDELILAMISKIYKAQS